MDFNLATSFVRARAALRFLFPNQNTRRFNDTVKFKRCWTDSRHTDGKHRRDYKASVQEKSKHIAIEEDYFFQIAALKFHGI